MRRATIDTVKKQISNLMQQLGVVGGSIQNSDFEGSSVQGTDTGYMLRRFLLETESVIDESRPSSPVCEELDTVLDKRLSATAGAASGRRLQVVSIDRHAEDETQSPRNRSYPNSVTIRTGQPALSDQSALGRTPSGGSHKVFGVSLDDLYIRDNSKIPLFVLHCLSAVEEHAMRLEGVYNISGSIRFLREFEATIDISK